MIVLRQEHIHRLLRVPSESHTSLSGAKNVLSMHARGYQNFHRRALGILTPSERATFWPPGRTNEANAKICIFHAA